MYLSAMKNRLVFEADSAPLDCFVRCKDTEFYIMPQENAEKLSLIHPWEYHFP